MSEQERPTPRVDLLEALLGLMNEQQLAMLVEDLQTACSRETESHVTIVCKHRGPAFINITLGRDMRRGS